jgi:hypothetical protein
MLRLRFSLFMSQRGALTASAEGPVDAFPAQRNASGLILRRLNLQIPQANQVVGGSCEREDPSHLEDSTMPNLPQQRDRLQPSEALFNAFPFPLTDGISGVLRRTSINGAPNSRVFTQLA